MLIGVLKETKAHEHRVGLTPESVAELVVAGHSVIVERGAGLGIGATDDLYVAAGGKIGGSADAIFETAAMIVKVKEPQAEECRKLGRGQVLFTYLHLAPDRVQTDDLLAAGVTAVAYETVTDESGGLPLLKPMSQVAGRMSIPAGATALQKASGGRGVLLGGAPGVRPASVVILGGGVVGFHAAANAVGMGADVTILDRSIPVLERLQDYFAGRAKILYATSSSITEAVESADLIIGAVLVAGAEAPKLLTRDMLGSLRRGAVLVDVAIDQGGCFETSRPTTHVEPTYIEQNIVHYCVANMPGAVARTSTYALNNATLPYVFKLANMGWREALASDAHLRRGLNVHDGMLTCEAVGVAQGRDHTPAELVLN